MKRFLSFIVMFGSLLFAKAAYLENVPVTVTQPDGTKLECLASGDEFYNYLHDAQGFTIIQDHLNGFYVYADLRNGELVPTDLVAGRSNPAGRLKPYLNISPEKRMEKRKAWDVPEHLRKPETRSRDTNHGTLNNIVIFIRFADDAEFVNSFNSVNNMFNENQSGVSMQSYFKEASYNQINIPTTFYPAPNGDNIISYQDTQDRSHFQPYDATMNPNGYNGDSERTEREHALLERAVNYITANNMIPGNLNVDYDNDGYVDNVCFVVRGNVGAWSSLLWPHQWSLYTRAVYINSKRVYTFNFQLADAVNNFNTSTMCHEMNHSLGAPDLYHYSYTGPTPVGKWDLMQSNATPPQHMGAYMKYMYGKWIDEIPEITEPGVYTLHDISSITNNCYKIASPESNQYYVLEYRKKTVEAAIPGTGLLIYRINTDEEGFGNRYWDGVTRFDEVYIFRPDGTTTVDGSINSAYFSAGSGRTAFDSSTNPKPFLIDGTVDENLMISNISAAGETISFSVGSTCDAPTNLTASISGNEVTLTWNAVEDIATYSVYRNNALIDNSVATTSFTDHLSAYGNYSYYVKSNCPDGGKSMTSNQAEVSYVYPGPVVTNLTGDVDGNIVTLEWTKPESRTATLEYFTINDDLAGCLGFGNTNTTFYWGMRYPTSMLSDYNGMSINSITMPFRYAGTYNIKIYQGDNTTNANLVFGGGVEIGSSLLNSFITINLSPVILDCSKDLWITVSVYGIDFPAYYGSFPAGGNYACLYSSDGISWVNYDLNYSWTIFTTITDGTFTYNISKDGAVIAQKQSGSSYNYTETENGFHEYHLTTNYFGGESQPSNSVYVPAGSDNQFVDNDNSNWSDPDNWSSGKPDENSKVWIKNDVIIDEDVTVNSLYINENTSVTVESGVTLTISDAAQNLSGIDGLVIESGAALVTNAENLQATVKREIESDISKDRWTGKWHFLSTPVEGQSLERFTESASGNGIDLPSGHGQTGNVVINPQNEYDFYLYHEPTMMWANIKTDNFSPDNLFFTENGSHDFVPGRGYLVSFDNDETIPFKGTVNQGETTVNLTAVGATLTGFNLIGNPYPCSIDWDAENGWTRNVLGDNPYIWIYNDDVHQYGAYQLGNEGVGTNGVTNIIASCQGFFVKAVENGNLIINDDVKTTKAGVFRKGNDSKSISIKVSGKNGSDEVMVCTTGEKFNNAEKLYSMRDDVPSLYFKTDGEKYSIVNVNDDENIVIPMGFECGVTGKFIISSNSDVELIDKLTGNVIDLSSNNYEFVGSNADDCNRFLVRISNDSDDDELVYQNGDELIVKDYGRVQIFDCLGRVVVDEFVNDGKISVSSFNTGVYVVRMNSRNQKIVIK